MRDAPCALHSFPLRPSLKKRGISPIMDLREFHDSLNMYRITFLNGPAEGRRLTVRTGSVRIGRGAECAVRVSDPAMADQHAEIVERDGRTYMRNLDPLHGIEVDGRRAEAAEILIRGKERLKIGSTLFRIEPMAEPARTAPRRVTGLQALAILAIVGLMAGQAVLIAVFSKIHGGGEAERAALTETMAEAPKIPAPEPKAPATAVVPAVEPKESKPAPAPEAPPPAPKAPELVAAPETPATPAPAEAEKPKEQPEPPAAPAEGQKPATPPAEPEKSTPPPTPPEPPTVPAEEHKPSPPAETAEGAPAPKPPDPTVTPSPETPPPEVAPAPPVETETPAAKALEEPKSVAPAEVPVTPDAEHGPATEKT